MHRLRLPTLALTVALTLSMASCGQRANDAGGKTNAAAGSTTQATGQMVATGDFKAPLGVQLWSFRSISNDLPAMLSTVRGMGFTHVETAGMYGLSAQQFADALRKADLRATSMHVSYEELKTGPDSVIAKAKALGATYVGIAWYPHDSTGFTLANAKQAVQDFNAFGKTLKAAGLQFFYHNHGYEPVAYENGTLLDYIIQQTDSSLVKFEMDVLWTWLPNLDPVALIQKYPGRFKLMHIKDMKPGLPRGSLSGGIADSLKAVIGQGQVNWPAVLQAAERDGFAAYFVEDETMEPVKNAPQSVAYLTSLTYK
jgi:sugar phosphate isomerase/epimerase